MPTPPQIHALHRLEAEGNFPHERRTPPGWLIEKLYNEKLLGGFKRKNLCRDCNMLRSANGTCSCTE